MSGIAADVSRGERLLSPRSVMAFAGTALILAAMLQPSASLGFEGRITATLSRGADTRKILYTVTANDLRIERAEPGAPHAINLISLATGELILVLPHNRSFVRIRAHAPDVAMPGAPGFVPPGFPVAGLNAGGATTPPLAAPPQLPGVVPPGLGPATGTNPSSPQVPAMPTMPTMPGAGGMPMIPMPGERLELAATAEKKTILGYSCTRFDVHRRGETMEIWATDQLLPFDPWRENQARRFGPPSMEVQWPALLNARRLFPLVAILRAESGLERLRFEVTSIVAEKVDDRAGKLFQPPSGYLEIPPLP